MSVVRQIEPDVHFDAHPDTVRPGGSWRGVMSMCSVGVEHPGIQGVVGAGLLVLMWRRGRAKHASRVAGLVACPTGPAPPSLTPPHSPSHPRPPSLICLHTLGRPLSLASTPCAILFPAPPHPAARFSFSLTSKPYGTFSHTPPTLRRPSHSPPHPATPPAPPCRCGSWRAS